MIENNVDEYAGEYSLRDQKQKFVRDFKYIRSAVGDWDKKINPLKHLLTDYYMDYNYSNNEEYEN